MRENRPSGSEGGGAGTQTGPSYPYSPDRPFRAKSDGETPPGDF